MRAEGAPPLSTGALCRVRSPLLLICDGESLPKAALIDDEPARWCAFLPGLGDLAAAKSLFRDYLTELASEGGLCA